MNETLYIIRWKDNTPGWGVENVLNYATIVQRHYDMNIKAIMENPNYKLVQAIIIPSFPGNDTGLGIKVYEEETVIEKVEEVVVTTKEKRQLKEVK